MVTAMSVAACSVVGGKAAEEPAFRVVIEDGDFQVRDYDAYAVAEVVVPRDFDGTSRVGFDDIRNWSMAFVLPEGYTKETAPVPTNAMVKIRDVAPRRAASVRFSGLLRDKAAEEHRRKLAAWLDERGLEHEGDWRVAGYNPPWTIPQLRRNEVLVSLR